MKLYDYLVTNNGDYDCYDTIFDMCVTVCFDIPDETEIEPYDEFCNTLYKLVDFVKTVNHYTLIVDWYGFIKKNYDKFKEYANDFWIRGNHDDEDDFIYEWIKELHLYVAGYASNEQYTWMTSVFDRCQV